LDAGNVYGERTARLQAAGNGPEELPVSQPARTGERTTAEPVARVGRTTAALRLQAAARVTAPGRLEGEPQTSAPDIRGGEADGAETAEMAALGKCAAGIAAHGEPGEPDLV